MKWLALGKNLNAKLFALALLVLTASSLHAEPWGKDAELVKYSCHKASRTPAPKSCPTPLLGQFAEVMIGYHNDVISHCDGPRSHFNPSSSYYTLESMRRYGFIQGWIMGCDRLMRENDDDWVYPKIDNENGLLIKYDPVP